ncbi:hypothetical protein FKM82_030831 [Ascaphus truei]
MCTYIFGHSVDKFPRCVSWSVSQRMEEENYPAAFHSLYPGEGKRRITPLRFMVCIPEKGRGESPRCVSRSVSLRMEEAIFTNLAFSSLFLTALTLLFFWVRETGTMAGYGGSHFESGSR